MSDARLFKGCSRAAFIAGRLENGGANEPRRQKSLANQFT